MVNTNPSFSQEEFKSFKDISFKLGSNSHLVQAAGGNTSIKSDGRMLIKASGTWFWSRPLPIPTINENPNVRWDSLKNKPFRFKTNGDISSATMDWYIRIEYLKINVTAGFNNNVDTTVT